MNILLESRVFYPSVGGLEVMSHELATAWQERGHQVRIVTVTPLEGADELEDLDVVRRPSFAVFRELLQWSDAFVQSGISLKSLGSALLAQRPIVFIHHNILKRPPGRVGIRNQLKRVATYLGHNVAISRPVGDSIPGPKTRIPNTYRPIFRDAPEIPDAECSGLLFVGRLVSVKGCDLALDALAYLHANGEEMSLAICGDGPERPALEKQAQNLGLEEYIHFEGWTAPSELARYYAQAEVALIPSRYEPFGIVALEALSCGCPVVAARTGGLPEAVGTCGLLFEPGNVEALAEKIHEARKPAVRERLRSHQEEHLACHHIDHIADRYLDVLHAAVHR